MPPFQTPVPVLRGYKEKAESLTVNGDRLYVGTSSGKLQVFQIGQEGNGGPAATLVTEKTVSRKAIDQLHYIKDINSLAALSDSSVSLYTLPDLGIQTPLSQARYAFSFAVHSTVQHILPEGLSNQSDDVDDVAGNRLEGVPTMVTFLAVGCRRRLLLYSWKDGEAQPIKEAALPHSARTIIFMTPQTLCMAYSVTEHVLFSLETMSASELTLPAASASTASAIGNMGMGALTGLGGYMALGMGVKVKPVLLKLEDGEVLIPRDNSGIFVGSDGRSNRAESVEWPSTPEELAYVKPYFLAVLPPGSVPDPSNTINSHALQIRSSLSLLPVQTLNLPFLSSSSSSPLQVLRLLTALPAAKPSLFAVTAPSDRNAVASEGSTIWMLRMRSWSEQIDELIAAGSYKDALALIETIDKAALPNKEERQARIQGLHAVALFQQGEHDKAINAFIELDINPAKIIALFPQEISGRLFVSQDRWIPLFGGPETKADNTAIYVKTESDGRSPSRPGTARPASPADSLVIPGRPKEKVDPFRRSLETLVRYLSDRRPKLKGALEAVHITPADSHKFPFLSEMSVDELMSLPNAPFSSLAPEQLTRFAQLVDTALFKSYLIIRPGLLGPLCRLDNWCEVSEIEEVLRERGKHSELIFLFNGKKMHNKALLLLRHLGEKESDKDDRLRPTVSYLQKLGPEYIEQVFSASRWVFEQDHDSAFEIFTSEETELPRTAVADFLEEMDPKICARYIEFLIAEREETSEIFHDRLAELYLSLTMAARNAHVEADYNEWYTKFLKFIDTSSIYRIDRLFGLLPGNDLFEARAILLGRLGRHDAALETFVYRLHDYLKAEEYCKRTYIPDSRTEDIFLVLLRIYLQPSQGDEAILLRAALQLISRHGPRLDTIETLQLLPPMVTAQEVKTFLYDALREPLFDTKVLREIGKARCDQVARKLISLQSKRVKITDSRICPQCHKRIGNSVIAVHAPRGEVTHYQCREAFARART